MMARHQYADANLYAHITTLRLACAVLAVLLAIAIVGWTLSSRTHRLSLPPLLEYAPSLQTGEIQPWEVYNFAGYIWQYLNRCEANCETELPQRQNKMGSFITPQFASTLDRSRAARAGELRDRTRYILPLEGGWSPALATTMSKGRWRVTLDVLLVEKLRAVEVKRVPIRYSIIVEQHRIDPEYNPWGLYLAGFASPPTRITETRS